MIVIGTVSRVNSQPSKEHAVMTLLGFMVILTLISVVQPLIEILWSRCIHLVSPLR